jgi:hypothetical protein
MVMHNSLNISQIWKNKKWHSHWRNNQQVISWKKWFLCKKMWALKLWLHICYHHESNE